MKIEPLGLNQAVSVLFVCPQCKQKATSHESVSEIRKLNVFADGGRDGIEVPPFCDCDAKIYIGRTDDGLGAIAAVIVIDEYGATLSWSRALPLPKEARSFTINIASITALSVSDLPFCSECNRPMPDGFKCDAKQADGSVCQGVRIRKVGAK